MVCVFVASACSAGPDEAGEETESLDQGQTEQAEDETSAGTGATGDDDSDNADGDPDEDGEDGEDAADDRSASGGPEPPVLEPSISGQELAARLSDLPGRLAVGNGPELAVARPDGLTIEVLDGSESVLASQPTWSRDGEKLAWGSVSAERQVVLVETFDEEGGRTGDPERSNVEGQPVFYLQWGQADDRLAYIRNSTTGGLVEVGLVEPGLPAQPVGEGAPFFISWSPSPDRILAHVNEVSVDAFGLGGTSDEFVSVRSVDGGFSAPAWVDDDRGLIVSDGALSYLEVATGDVEPIVPLAGPVRFVVSPDKTKVAYQVVGGEGGLTVVNSPVQAERSGLVVLDLETGSQTVITADLALAFEFSPDSDKLAWLTATIDGGRPIGRWHFWSTTDSVLTNQSFDFVLTRKYGRSYLPFFAQYAQSVTGWSPDSSAFAFAGSIDRRQGVWIQLVDEIVAPQLVAPGDFVTWGAGQAPPPTSGGASAA